MRHKYFAIAFALAAAPTAANSAYVSTIKGSGTITPGGEASASFSHVYDGPFDGYVDNVIGSIITTYSYDGYVVTKPGLVLSDVDPTVRFLVGGDAGAIWFYGDSYSASDTRVLDLGKRCTVQQLNDGCRIDLSVSFTDTFYGETDENSEDGPSFFDGYFFPGISLYSQGASAGVYFDDEEYSLDNYSDLFLDYSFTFRYNSVVTVFVDVPAPAKVAILFLLGAAALNARRAKRL